MREKDSYYDAALWAHKNGMSISSAASTAFIGKVEVTRAEILFCLWKNAGSPASTTEFSDIFGKEKEAVGWAVDTKVAEPQSANKFGGTTKCTHEEASSTARYAASFGASRAASRARAPDDNPSPPPPRRASLASREPPARSASLDL